jgi:hypothetical protein
MNQYINNPKTEGSGIYCAIPQTERCPMGCKDCFFQSGRSYLEPLAEHLPNMPPAGNTHIIRVNDGNDSFTLSDTQIDEIEHRYRHFFFNTSIPKWASFRGMPFVLTINPGEMTDTEFRKIDQPPKNLMFVRFRVNTWNLQLMIWAISYYSFREVPIVLTFMAYHNEEDIPLSERPYYMYRKRTLNSYWAITTKGFDYIMNPLKHNKWVYSCGKIEGEEGNTHCRFCGNCLREFFATKERLA